MTRADRVRNGLVRECGISTQHFEHDTTESPNVRSLVCLFAAGLFRTHVGGSADDNMRSTRGNSRIAGWCQLGDTCRTGFRQSKVENLDATVTSKLDICWLQVAMNDASLVSSLERKGDLLPDS
jgi:hypothetical protein